MQRFSFLPGEGLGSISSSSSPHPYHHHHHHTQPSMPHYHHPHILPSCITHSRLPRSGRGRGCGCGQGAWPRDALHPLPDLAAVRPTSLRHPPCPDQLLSGVTLTQAADLGGGGGRMTGCHAMRTSYLSPLTQPLPSSPQPSPSPSSTAPAPMPPPPPCPPPPSPPPCTYLAVVQYLQHLHLVVAAAT